MSKEVEAGSEVYSVQQQEGGTEEIYEDMTGEHSSTTEPVEVLDESIGEGRTNAFEKKRGIRKGGRSHGKNREECRRWASLQ